MQRIGDECAREIFQEHRRLLDDAVIAAGGTKVQWTGDGLMVVFASVGDAVGCALAMQEIARRQTGEVQLCIRVGLNAGEVLRDDEGNGYFGTPVVTARRLCDRAEPGTVLCADTVAQLLAGRQTYRFRDRGRLALKGIAGRVRVCEALPGNVAPPVHATVPMQRAGPATDALPLSPLLARTEQFAFAGRRRELDTLTALWREAASGTKHIVLLEGEPGIGKTRVAAETARVVHAAGGTVLFGRCDEEMGVPFQPFVEALEYFLAHSTERELHRQLGVHAGELVRLVPDLVYRIPRLPPPLESDPETERYRLFDAVAGWLAAASSARPILLVLDDLHWAAKPTLLLLRHIARAGDPARLLIIGTHRDTEVDRTHPLAGLLADLRAVPGVERLLLQGLDENEVVEFMERVA